MKIQVLCSTMNSEKPLFTQKGFQAESNLIINQIKSENEFCPNFINFYERGLSKSRNRGIENSEADICLITDNDVYFDDNLLKIIETYFNKHTDADILTFQIETPEGEPFKEYKNKFFWHNKLSLAKVCSVEIAFRRKSILEKKIKFDESFGLGTKFPTGEEYIFLSDSLKAGLKIAYIPKVIAYHPKESSGNNFDNLDLIKAKGAMINRVFGIFGLPLCLLFSLKKYKKSDLSFLKFFKVIIAGYLKIK